MPTPVYSFAAMRAARKENRAGSFLLKAAIIDRRPEIAYLILSHVLIAEAESSIRDRGIRYFGWSPLFSPVPKNGLAPVYSFTVLDPDGNLGHLVSIDIQATKELRQRAREEQDMWVCPRVIRIRPKITPPPIEERLMESEVDVEITILDDETFDKDALEYPLDEDIPF